MSRRNSCRGAIRHFPLMGQPPGALRPVCRGRGAHAHPSPFARRIRRSTPAVRPVPDEGSDQPQPSDLCPAGEGPTSNFNRRTEPGTEALASTPSNRPALVAKDQRQTPHCQHSLLGKARATGITHPGFYGRKPWRKPNSGVIIAGLRRRKDPTHAPTPKIASKFTPASAMRSITAKAATTSVSESPRPVPRSRAWPAPSLYRRGPSCAS